MAGSSRIQGAWRQRMLLWGEPADAFEWFKVDVAVSNVKYQRAKLTVPI